MITSFGYGQHKAFAYRVIHILSACFFATMSIVLAISLLTHSITDESLFFHADPAMASTSCLGYWGASLAAMTFFLLGTAGYLLPVLCWYMAWWFLAQARDYTGMIHAIAAVVVSSLATAYLGVDRLGVMPGGALGQYGIRLLANYFDALLIGVLLSVLAIAIFFVHAAHFWLALSRGVLAALAFAIDKERCLKPVACWCQRLAALGMMAIHWFIGVLTGATVKKESVAVFEELIEEEWHYTEEVASKSDQDIYGDDEELFVHESCVSTAPDYNASEGDCVDADEVDELYNEQERFHLPDISMVFAPSKQKQSAQLSKEYENLSRILEEKLERFGIKGSVVSVKIGPVITLFEYQPDIDSKISKIIALEDDLALALQALSIRIIAPIPGRAVVGFEVSNKERQDVLFNAIVHDTAFVDGSHHLPLILGHDVIGQPKIIDLAKSPHLLVAGSTGSGKSVALNAMLVSLLCKHTPKTMKLILIDPKRLEFASFADIAHLYFPIVTDPRKAAPVLRWVVQTMEERYACMEAVGVRNIFEYHERQAEDSQLEGMPFIVVVIDELSDLMMTTGKEIEDLIARITQMARAAGIHMIVATQRPSVDVITGLIKVNFPSRVSFKVTSKIDSRTILDCAGADKLLGKGDMLYLDSASQLNRAHGAYVSQREIDMLIKHIRAQEKPQYINLQEALQQAEAPQGSEDPLYDEVKAFLETVDEVSISSLQRKFRIGYNRSARLIELLEAHGLLLNEPGSKMRKVIRS